MNLSPTLNHAPNSLELIILLAVVSSLGCHPRITSTAKPKPPPSIQVRLPDLNAASVSTSPATIHVPVLQPFIMNVTAHGIDAQARKKGLISLHFLPPKGSEDEAKNWFYGSAFLIPKDENAATWECTGICQSVGNRAVPMRMVVALGDVATEKPIAEFKVEAIADFKTKE